MSTPPATTSKLATAIAKQDEKPTLAGILTSDGFKKQIASALPKHITADRLVRIALTNVRQVPALANCDQTSFLGAVMACAQLGLEPGNGLGHAYLIPFQNNKKGITECQFIPGYRGLIDLARRSGQIVSLYARAVREGDEFRYSYGLDETLHHVPVDSDDQRALTHVYAVAKLRDGGIQFEVMTRRDVEAVRAKSESGRFGPWVDHFEEMAKKTAVRRLFKYLPVSVELAQASTMDEKAEAGISPSAVYAEQGLVKPVEGEDSTVDEGTPEKGKQEARSGFFADREKEGAIPTPEELAEMEADMNP